MMVMEATEGGAARHLEEIVVGLSKRGYAIHVIFAQEREPRFADAVQRMRDAGAETTELSMIRRLSPLGDLKALVAIKRVIESQRPQIIHGHSSKAGGLVRILRALGLGVPVVYTPHGYAFLDTRRRGRSFIYSVLERLLSPYADAVVAVSPSEARISIDRRLVPKERVHTACNGVSVSPGTYCAPRDSVDELTLGSLCRLESQKAPTQLIEVASSLAASRRDFRMLIGGTGRLRDACRNLIRKHGLEDRVRLLGRITDLEAFYRSLDIYVTTSTFEGLPYAIMDAMKFGLPVVGFDVPGVVDLVDHGKTGFLVPAGGVCALAERAALLVGDFGLRSRLGSAGQLRVDRFFQPAAQIESLVEVYSQVLENSPLS